MKIACEKCGALFEAADDQELCAACRDAAEIGDRYEAMPAVITAAPGPADLAPPRFPPPPEEFPNLWGIRSLRRVVPEALRIWRASAPAMLAIGLAYSLICEAPVLVRALVLGDLTPGQEWYAARLEIVVAFATLWEFLATMPATVCCIVLIVLTAAETAARRRRPALRAVIGCAWARFGRALGAVVVLDLAVFALKTAGNAAGFLVTDDPAGFWDASAASSAEREFVRRLIAEWLPTVPVAFLTMRWELSTSAAVFERARPLRALSRAAVLVKQRWLPAAAIIGLAYAIMRFPIFVIENAASLGTLSMETTRVIWNTIAFGFCNVLVFALYAALRDRELARAGTED